MKWNPVHNMKSFLNIQHWLSILHDRRVMGNHPDVSIVFSLLVNFKITIPVDCHEILF